MGVTRRYWGGAGLVAVLAGLAVLFDRPLLLAGAGGVAGWVLARQYAFVRDVSRVADDVSVAQSPERDAITVEDVVEFELSAELSRPSPVAVDVEARPPPGVERTGGDPRATLPVGGRAAHATFEVRCPLAGEFRFGAPTATATDAAGRFRTSFPAGEPRRVTVDPRGPRNLHVGAGGETADAPYGDSSGNKRGSGLDLAELRAYVPGDSVRQIDWKATARLDQPHVREFETDVERRTALFLDCRPSMGDGPAGGTKFDYAREVALGIVEYSRDRNEQMGLYAVGEAGLVARHPAVADEEGYASLERRLRALELPDAGTTDEAVGPVRSPAVARRRAEALRNDGSAFAGRLRPFFADADPYVERIEADPLYRAVRTDLERLRGAVTAAVVTDDAARVETREAVKFARRHSDHVLAFLTPTALFEREAATDPGAAYERYVDFERFRRELARLDDVSAFEVGPGDRVDAVLAANDARRRATAGERR